MEAEVFPLQHFIHHMLLFMIQLHLRQQKYNVTSDEEALGDRGGGKGVWDVRDENKRKRRMKSS
jgi:hypothetical protein